jgi:hypothetical protein
MDVEMQRKLVYRPRAHSDPLHPLPVWYLGLPYRYPGVPMLTVSYSASLVG